MLPKRNILPDHKKNIKRKTKTISILTNIKILPNKPSKKYTKCLNHKISNKK